MIGRNDDAFLAAHDRWWIGHPARFLGKLNAVNEGGGTLLSRTMVGYGGGMSWSHNPNNLPMLLAGGSALGIRHGEHRRYNTHRDQFGATMKDATSAHPAVLCDLWRSMSETMGVPAAGFGDSTQCLDALFRG